MLKTGKSFPIRNIGAEARGTSDAELTIELSQTC